MAGRLITTLYWSNIDRKMVEVQAQVFAHLGYRIEQVCRTGMEHGRFLDEVMAALPEDGSVLIVDIDCFATEAAIIEKAFALAEQGALIGCAQTTEHIDARRIFTAPLFMALSKALWLRLGRPSFQRSKTGDVAQDLHDLAKARGVPVHYIMPQRCLIPKWDLAGKAVYGIGTFYEGGVFHLYQSRYTPYRFAFFEVAAAVLANQPIDFLALSQRAMRLYAFEPLYVKARRLVQLNGLKRLARRLRG